jgi:DNA repair photolyase
LESGALPPLQRLQLIQQLKAEGFLAGVNAIPVLPFISDTEEELEKIIASAKNHKSDYILIGGLTLSGNEPADSKVLYYNFLQRYNHNLISAYEKLYGANFYAPWSYQNELKRKAHHLCRQYNIRSSIIG